MNINCRPFGTTTAAHMHANERQEALYPVVGYTREVEGGPVIKLGWLFVSDDLKHDYEQVKETFGNNGNSSFQKIYKCN